MAKAVKPPLGLTPKLHWDNQRLADIQEAIIRYSEAGMEIPLYWIQEYNQLVKTT